MNRSTVVVGLVVLLVLVAGAGTVLYTGVGPAPGGDSDDTIEEFPTATPADGAGAEADSDTESSADTPPFSFTIDDVVECGMTCRDVTATLHNNQDRTATGVNVFIRVFAGEDNTDTDDLVWEGVAEVGPLEANASHTSTERIELSFQEARTIDQRGGWITILTTVDTDTRTVTFQDSEQVA